MTTTDLRTNERQVLAITGMTCGSCARNVERALSGVRGVRRATVDFGSGQALVEGSAKAADLISAVDAAGYAAKPTEGELDEGGVNERRGSGCCR